MARFVRAELVAVVTLLVARVWAAAPGLAFDRPLLENIWDIVDIRRGDWAWGPGFLAGIFSLVFFVRNDEIKIQEATRAVLVTLLISVLPQLFRPVASGAQAVLPEVSLPRLVGQEIQEPALLPKASVITFWATWCGPCRSELPLLAREMQKGQPIELVNVGESGETVARFLAQHHPKLQTWYASHELSQALQVRGFPTTIVVNAQGQVVDRHLGVLSAAQLLKLVRKAKEPAD